MVIRNHMSSEVPTAYGIADVLDYLVGASERKLELGRLKGGRVSL
jgi:hypothetical protein